MNGHDDGLVCPYLEDTIPMHCLGHYLASFTSCFAEYGKHAGQILALSRGVYADVVDLTHVQTALQLSDFFAQFGALGREF
jgi:hypothetical protein